MSSNRQPIQGPFAWTGSEIAGTPSWQRSLDQDAVAAIDAALEAFERLQLPWREATAETFGLEGLEAFFDDLRDELEDGVGFVRVRGLPVERYTPEQLRAIFLAIGQHVGMPVSQNLSGERLLGLTDEGRKAAVHGAIDAKGDGRTFLASRARAYSTGELRFHTDRCDVVGLLCVRKAKSGGVSRIASAVAIHNAMLERAPDLLDALFKDYPRSRFGEEVQDASAFLHAAGVRIRSRPSSQPTIHALMSKQRRPIRMCRR